MFTPLMPIPAPFRKKYKKRISKKTGWKKLNNRQVIKTIVTDEGNTIFVIAPKNYKKLIIPLFCPLCDLPMLTKEDVDTYKKHELCEKCHYAWLDKDIEEIMFTPKFQEYMRNRIAQSKLKINLK